MCRATISEKAGSEPCRAYSRSSWASDLFCISLIKQPTRAKSDRKSENYFVQFRICYTNENRNCSRNPAPLKLLKTGKALNPQTDPEFLPQMAQCDADGNNHRLGSRR